MSVDPKRAFGATLPVTVSTWSADDVILYHLGIGAGIAQASEPRELEYTYEANLKTLPSFGVTAAFDAVMHLNAVDGIDIDYTGVLHGEQDLVIHRPVPVAAEVENRSRISGVYDKGNAALIILEVETHDAAGPLFTNRSSIFARGEGGFGGEPGPKTASHLPDREPDHIVESATMSHQALIYRLSGDKNPLHADPAYAALGGFDRPILHGLCTYGVVCKAAVDTVLEGDVARVARYQVRFAGVVYPGETIVTSLWDEGDQVHIAATTAERRQPVLSHATILTHG